MTQFFANTDIQAISHMKSKSTKSTNKNYHLNKLMKRIWCLPKINKQIRQKYDVAITNWSFSASFLGKVILPLSLARLFWEGCILQGLDIDSRQDSKNAQLNMVKTWIAVTTCLMHKCWQSHFFPHQLNLVRNLLKFSNILYSKNLKTLKELVCQEDRQTR